jgi:hypothetical protein
VQSQNKPVSDRQRLKNEILDDVLQEKKIMSQNACELLFSQISTKISHYKRTIHVSLVVLLFFFFWPFLIFFFWIEQLAAYIIISGLSSLGIYQKRYEMKMVEQWE